MTCPTGSLEAYEIQEGLGSLPQWSMNNNALERVYQAKSYLEGLDRLNAIAQMSEAENHHPELLLEWRKLTIRYWTHTAHGITQRDFDLASQVETLLSGSAGT